MKKVQTKLWMFAMFLGAVLSFTMPESAYADGIEYGSGVNTVIDVSTEASGSWKYTDGKWYYYDADGNLGKKGWVQDRNQYYYLEEDGSCLISQMTPDGYYVDANGAWYQRTAAILNQTFRAPQKFPAIAPSWIGEKELKKLQIYIDDLFETRRIRITDTSVEYLAGASDEETIIGIYKDVENGAYNLVLHTHLDKTSVRKDKIDTYDYMIFSALLCQITSTPELLEDAVYSSWEEENRWNISRTDYRTVGDALVKYTAGNGYGCYNIYPAASK